MAAIQQLLASYGAPVATANTFFHQVRTGTGASASITPGFNSTDLGALFISKRTNAAQNHFITDSITGTGTSLQLPSTSPASAAAHIKAGQLLKEYKPIELKEKKTITDIIDEYQSKSTEH